MKKSELLTKFGMEDPMKGFEPLPDTQLWGWNGDAPLLPAIVAEVKPKLLIEIGSWMGQSGVHFAKAVKELQLDCSVICVDTWLGSVEHWMDPNLRPKLELVNGYPSFYKRFLTNVKNAAVEDVVLPLPMPSLIAANFLKENKIMADVIYVDGSHDQNDVFNDLSAYWKLLNDGGILFGDDWPWDSVREAVQAFAAEVGQPVLQQGVHWIFRKRV